MSINPKPDSTDSPPTSEYMALANFFCANSSRNMVVKIIYPGGRIELHDRPILAAEIMQRNPKCCVTRPNVFRDPSAVVPPDTVLMLGQKFYVVPKSTLRKLHRHSAKNPRRLHVQSYSPRPTNLNGHRRNASTPKRSFSCLKQSDVELDDNSLGESSRSSINDERCFKFLHVISKIKPVSVEADSMRTRENRMEIRGHPILQIRNSTPTTPSFHWQPSLDSISEE